MMGPSLAGESVALRGGGGLILVATRCRVCMHALIHTHTHSSYHSYNIHIYIYAFYISFESIDIFL